MSNRLTSRWAETAEEAFGERGAKGERGEQIAKRIIEMLGHNVTHHPADKQLQMSGIDLYIDGKYGVDVKNNLKTNRDVCIEQDKLFKSKATFWIHVNDEDHDDFVIYKTEDARQWVENNASPFDDLVWVPREVAYAL
jgi:hypothetical protein